jgi:hypothetical protein
MSNGVRASGPSARADEYPGVAIKTANAAKVYFESDDLVLALIPNDFQKSLEHDANRLSDFGQCHSVFKRPKS